MLSSERGDSEDALRGAVLAGGHSAQAAWRALYDGAFAGLWTYVTWRCAGLRDLAEEITQETWLVAVRRVRDFDPHKGRFQAWLRGIAANVVRSHLRQHRRPQPPRSGNEVVESIDQQQGRTEQAEVIVRALAELPERYEAVLRAKYLDAQSVAQIGAEWGQSDKAVESLLTRARQALRTAYEKLTSQDVIVREPSP